MQGATSAYISDCTSDGSRAHVFSRFTGVFYLGFSLGPAIGAYLIRHPLFTFPSSSGGHNSIVPIGQPTVTSVFYVAAFCSFINLLLVLFVFPESLNQKAKPAKPTQTLVATSENGDASGGPAKETWSQRFLSPIALLMPRKIPRPEGGYRSDYSVTILGITLFFYMLAMVSSRYSTSRVERKS